MDHYFDYVHARLPQVIAHNAQVEKGTKIFNDLFVPHMKGDKKLRVKQFGPHLFVAEHVGLMALAEPKYKFFIFGKYWPQASVYRIGDLVAYKEEKATKMVDGKPEVKKYVHFGFKGTEGMADFLYEYKDFKGLSKYFDTLFGIQKTLGNIGNTWKSQINAAKAIAEGVSAVAKGDEGAGDKAFGAVEALDAAVYGDRTELNAKADAALAPYNK